MRFESPWAFVLLLAIPLAIWFSRRARQTGTIRFSSIANASRSGRSWRTRFRHLPLALRVFALVLLTIGLARPQQGREKVHDVNEGVAIEMIVDRSGSMGQEMVYEGLRLNRLEVVKKIFKEFVLGNGEDLEGRKNDLIGMIVFARYADTVCPLTLSQGVLDRFIDDVHLVTQKSEDGTALGDGLALAAARLKTAEEHMKKRGASRHPDDYRIKSKVIILLTDGQSNTGKRAPLEAARLAGKWGIKVYTIGIGSAESSVTIQTPFGDYRVPRAPGAGVDEATLKAIAAETDGTYWQASTADKLRSIYAEIDQLEKSKIRSDRYMDYSERFPGFVIVGLAILCLEQLLNSSWLRRTP